MNLYSMFTYKGITLELVVWSMFIGIVLGAFSTLYNKSVLGSFVRKLRDAGADTPESAKTLAETGFANNPFVKFSLKLRGTYRKVVRAAPISAPEGGEEGAAQKKRRRAPKLGELKFYIPAEMGERADSFYSDKGASLFIAVITFALFFVVAILSFTVIPALIQMLKNFVEFITPVQ